jgi:two-component system CheB/CheR fusion protein
MTVDDAHLIESGSDAGQDDAASLRHALRASEARFRNVIGAIADGMVVVLGDGKIAFANPAAANLLGRAADDLRGQIFGIPIVAGETTEIDIQRRGGDVRVAELRVVETEWEGRPALLVSLHDVTERKHLEEALRRQAEQLSEADRRKDEFLAMLAHELRNPLAPILNAVHAMRMSGNDVAILGSMRDLVEQQVRHLARLVDDLLDVSRVSRGKIQLRKENLELAPVVQQALDAARPMIDAREHHLLVELGPDPVWLEADPTRLRQILTNLLDNAAKYTEPGGRIAVTVQSTPNEVVMTVSDSGIGISPEMLPRIFDMFTQADCSLDRSQGGLGIGLTLVKSLVTMHGGSVDAKSAGLGKGCEIVVRLPLSVPGTPFGSKIPQVASRTPAGQLERHILVVDDNKVSADSLALILELAGHRTKTAYTGAEAIKSVEVFSPEVVLMDLGLPGMDGFEVARQLRACDQTARTLLIAVTGYSHAEALEASRIAGFDHHMLKPLDLDKLLTLLGDTPRRMPKL